MTREQLDAIRARVEAATPGPWRYAIVVTQDERYATGPTHEGGVGAPVEIKEKAHTDALLIAHAPTDVHALLAEVERLRDAHAMAVQVSGELCEKCGWAMKFPGEKCRCELLAEVERLTADPLPAAAWVREVERAAFSRGVAAMREAAAGVKHYCDSCSRTALQRKIRSLPDPEDK